MSLIEINIFDNEVIQDSSKILPIEVKEPESIDYLEKELQIVPIIELPKPDRIRELEKLLWGL